LSEQGTTPPAAAFTELPDLAVRTLGGSVVYANDELFAARENLIEPSPPVFSPDAFGLRGKIYDGWETRRRREPGHDYALIRLGAPGVIRGVIVDTSFFTGNFPPEVSVEATGVEAYPSPAELADASWVPIVPRSAVQGDARSCFEVRDGHRFTHVRLSIYPDGGVARLRVHGEVVPDPRHLAGTVDLAAVENGGVIVGCSEQFYSSAANLIQPGRARTMADGWENARRRGGGNDWVTVRLAAAGRLRYAELDTSRFFGNAPGWARLSGASQRLPASAAAPPAGEGAEDGSDGSWFELLPRTRLQPDTRHRLMMGSHPPVAVVRLDVYPDGGMARLRLWGEPDPAAHSAAAARWLDSLLAAQAVRVLQDAGVSQERAGQVAAVQAGRLDLLADEARAALTPSFS